MSAKDACEAGLNWRQAKWWIEMDRDRERAAMVKGGGSENAGDRVSGCGA